MVTILTYVLVGLAALIVFFVGDSNGYRRGFKVREDQVKTLVKIGYDRGVKDSEQYVSDSMKKAMDLIEAELNKKGFTLKTDTKKPETEKDKKIEEALSQQRKKLEAVQSTPAIHKPKNPLRLVKTPTLTVIKNEDK